MSLKHLRSNSPSIAREKEGERVWSQRNLIHCRIRIRSSRLQEGFIISLAYSFLPTVLSHSHGQGEIENFFYPFFLFSWLFKFFFGVFFLLILVKISREGRKKFEGIAGRRRAEDNYWTSRCCILWLWLDWREIGNRETCRTKLIYSVDKYLGSFYLFFQSEIKNCTHERNFINFDFWNWTKKFTQLFVRVGKGCKFFIV